MSYDDNKRRTEAWQLYELGKNYNNSLVPNQYTLVDTNIEFFIGNQWKGLGDNPAMSALPKPVFNIIKRVTSLFVASLTSSSTKISFEPLANKLEAQGPDLTESEGPQIVEDQEAIKAAKMATSEVANILEKEKMDYVLREALFDGAQTGDYCAHFYWDANAKPYGGAFDSYRGEIKMEMVDGINVMFGNPNNHKVEDQPYILIYGRDMTKNLVKEYEQYHPEEDEDMIKGMILPDTNYQNQAGSGGKTELAQSKKTSKTSFIYMYRKKTKEVKLTNPDGTPKMEVELDDKGQPIQQKTKDGFPMLDAAGQPIYKEKQAVEIKTTVWVSKHTQNADFYEVDTDLTYYPIAWGNWQRQKNQYHGRALVTEMISNQIYINSMFALIMRHQQMLGFPKTLYDADVIGQWSNSVGQAIAVHNLPPDKRMSDLHSVIQPADMSTQIMSCIDRAIALTKECLGATDAQMGNVRPDNTSALIALQSSSQVPLENPQALKYEWVEDIGRILLDMMGTYYGKRPVVREEEQSSQIFDPVTGQPSMSTKKVKVVEMYDFSKLKNLWLNVRADVGASTYWSRIAIVQTLDNLKTAGILDVVDYLERMPDEYIPRKEELLSKLRNQLQTPPMMPGAPESNPGSGSPNASEATLVASLPQNMQQAYTNMGSSVKNALLQQASLTTPGV